MLAVSKRRPDLVILDNMADDNQSISLHDKRYQDIEYLLAEGISVYTTLNIESVQSLKKTVELILESSSKDSVPDRLFDRADQIELVDIDPSALLKRYDQMIRSKIIKRRQIDRYMNQNKLIALREIALRKAADQVFHQAIYVNDDDVTQKPQEHILVCVSASPTNAHVIRSAARMARAFNAAFTALYVGQGQTEQLSIDGNAVLAKNIKLAEELGAHISILYGHDLAEEIAEYAHISHVTKIVLGKSATKRTWWKTSFTDQLTKLAYHNDIYIIPDKTVKPTHRLFDRMIKPVTYSVKDTAKTIAIISLCTVIGIVFESWNVSDANIMTIYILGVLFNAVITHGKLYSILTTVISVLVFNYFFVSPRFTFETLTEGYPITFIVMLVAGLVTSILAERIKTQNREIAEKAYRTEILLETNQKLQQATSKEGVLSETVDQLIKLLDRMVIGFSVDEHGMVANKETIETQRDKEALRWVVENHEPSGVTTTNVSDATYLYLPIITKETVIAIVGIEMIEGKTLGIFEHSITQAILGECQLALERELLQRQQHDISLKMEEEQLRGNLLRGISHDLRTPLTSISGNAKVLLNSQNLTEAQEKELQQTIYDDAIWLINLVENLLSITRLDHDNMPLKLQPDVLEEIIREAVKHADYHLKNHHFAIDIADEMMISRVDSQLIIQVIVNLINNAVKYTPVGSEITLTAKIVGRSACIEVSDNGPGVSDSEKEKVFELFYKGSSVGYDAKRGLGLGLALCQSIIKAHGGKIYLKDNPTEKTGTSVGFTLPLTEVVIDEEL